MAEYIDRTALGIGKCNPNVFEDKGYAKGWNAAIDIIQNAPAADVRPVVRGKWIASECDDGYGAYYVSVCSECGDFVARCRNFCPNCGADMRNFSSNCTNPITTGGKT